MKKAVLQVTLKRHLFEGVSLLLSFILSFGILYQIKEIQSKPNKIEIVPAPVYEEAEEVHVITDDELSRLYSCKEEVTNDTCLLISQEDAERLMKIAVVEDFTSAESQAQIMRVILNRVASLDFPNSIKEVIEQPGQFSTVRSGAYAKAKPDANSHLALAMIEKGEVETDALYFEASYAKNTWQSRHLVYVSTVGGTKYYTVP